MGVCADAVVPLSCPDLLPSIIRRHEAAVGFTTVFSTRFVDCISIGSIAGEQQQ
jgi:hypothetical protein